MTRRRLLKFIAAGAILLVVSATGGGLYIQHVSRQSAIATAITWARLAPLPPSACNLQVEVKGSMFTREFVLTFDASPAITQQWLAASPGPSAATQTVAGPIATYAITPGGGAEFAEVKVDSRTGHVVVRTYWS